ncbi:hypothetical protein [Emticicia sp. 21SJ11W-3]|uniref:hypothetical protein n=1 Tax=Emticicia sp. 21SJ11W-3 TaxID=2916755 RepID=UPI00209E00AC|nr:hypothetical protein [Emticicia sp. 21SJ11W-3]UTA67649.1 hypothetical protein MB380_18915 [Emticicia sp. 21SJ11W-3]
MKKFFLLLLLVVGTDTYGFAMIKSAAIDSIVVNIGKRKKIVLWGATQEDLKALEKYDLNRIVRQMNQDLEEMPSNVRRSIRQDYEGNTYTKETTRQQELEGLTPWQRLTRNTYLNLSFGFSSARYLQRGNSVYNPYKNTSDLFRQKTFASPNISIGLMRQESFIQTGRKELLLHYGFDISWYYLNRDINNRVSYLLRASNTNVAGFDTVAVYRPSPAGNYYTIDNLVGTAGPKAESAYNQSLFYINFKIIPTVNFYGNSNQKTFHFGFGAYIGRLIGGSQIYPEIKSINQQDVKIPIKSKDNPYRYGLILNLGYKAFTFFLEGDVNNFFQSRNTRSKFPPYETVDMNWSQNLTTFGIRIGR